MTDRFGSYAEVGSTFLGGHHTVDHGKGEYVRGDASTNEVESYFALLKRGIMGSFHHISKHHLDRYCDEFSFRWNHLIIISAARGIYFVSANELANLSELLKKKTEKEDEA